MPLFLFSLTSVSSLSGCSLKQGSVQIQFSGTNIVAPIFSDPKLNRPVENPCRILGNGLFPRLYAAVGNYSIRVFDRDGVVLYQLDDYPCFDPNTQAQGSSSSAQNAFNTGDIKIRLDEGSIEGFVRLNGMTLGNASSGATERANSDCKDLYYLLWERVSTVSVVGGRGTSSASDWANNKPIMLPDFRGCAIGGIEGMGNMISSDRMKDAPLIEGTTTTLGALVGSTKHALSVEELAAHDHKLALTSAESGLHEHKATSASAGEHTHNFFYETYDVERAHRYPQTPVGKIETTKVNNAYQLFSVNPAGTHTHDITVSESGKHTHELSGTTEKSGDNKAFSMYPPMRLITPYIKL